jgi:DNA mismatch endonuclease, patch repair protein
MSRVRQSGTESELLVRALVRKCATEQYKENCRDLPGSPDLASVEGRWAIFVHGCFWHRHKACKKATIPKQNRFFWLNKFEANSRRDAQARRKLRRMGYRVLTVWECQTRDELKLDVEIRMFLKSG